MGYSDKSITDHLGRTFGTLRVSLINDCNLRCIYCVNPEVNASKQAPDVQKISEDKLVEIISAIHYQSPLHTIRITGGEPTLYKGLIGFVEKMRTIGIGNIKMTSNGASLEKLLPGLVSAGLSEINISLDAVNPVEYFAMSKRKNLDKTLRAIGIANDSNLKIKLNTVIVKGINDNQIMPMLKFAKSMNIVVRFLELMKMGHLFSNQFFSSFFSEEEILRVVRSEFSIIQLARKPGATANYWKTEDDYSFGIIANESSPFCTDCDRLRIDSQGKIFGCLSNGNGLAALDGLGEESKMREILYAALLQKQESKFTGSEMQMISIGG